VKIVFLHIPKTAGQSVHEALVAAYGAEAVCPARVNEQLYELSIEQLNRYRVVSGHLDWSRLDCIQGPKFVFTVLREPRDRILSFYFYLREQASRLSAEELDKPERQGMKAALTLKPAEYFLGGAPHLRRFLDDHYDNFYTHYFAGRHYGARASLKALVKRGAMTVQQLQAMAMSNLQTLDRVFTVEQIPELLDTVGALSGATLKPAEAYRVNVTHSVAAVDRLQRLRALGAGPRVMDRLQRFCALDDELWAKVRDATPPT
jgi:hypothetical protein